MHENEEEKDFTSDTVRVSYQSLPLVVNICSSCKDFDNAIASATDNPSTILTPDNRTNSFSTHQAMTCDLLRTAPLFQ
jgi:hypothetical protein